MSRRSPPALPPQPEDPVPVEHDSTEGDGGAGMVDAWTVLHNLIYTSPPRLLPPLSAWDTMMVSVGHLTPSPPRSPSPPWNFDDEQWLPQQMGPTANCSAAVLEAASQDTSHGMGMVMAYLVLATRSTCLTEAAEELDAVLRVVEKTFLLRGLVNMYLSCGLEIHTNTETRGSSLAMIESYDDVNELGDNDAEQTEISRKRPRNSLLVWLHFTEVVEERDAALRDLKKTILSRGLEIHMNTETGGGSLAMIESYDDDELGDNHAEQTEIPRKHPRNSSPVWLHFTKDSGKMIATCKYCEDALSCKPTHGTSHLLRHLESVHGINLSSSEARKEPQRSSCSQKLQITGSAACAGIPTPLSENDRHFEQGDTSRKPLKRTSRTTSDVWRHFTKLPSDDPSGAMAKCIYCNKTLKADPKNGTSSLWRHVRKGKSKGLFGCLHAGGSHPRMQGDGVWLPAWRREPALTDAKNQLEPG